jgi:hypothetical protein
MGVDEKKNTLCSRQKIIERNKFRNRVDNVLASWWTQFEIDFNHEEGFLFFIRKWRLKNMIILG